ncbi:MAG: hypothetical protein MRJ68_06120 [Nitrospira sp.]|nr:hypothetical protein [Nitrospira sp.]
MQKDRLATLNMDILVNHPTKSWALPTVYSRLSPWGQAEWDRARKGVPIAERAARLGHSVREQRRCDESLIEHIFAALNGRIFVVLDATYCFMTQRMLDRRTGRRIPPDAVRRFAAQPIACLLLSARAHQDLKQRGVHTIGDLLPHAYEWLSPKRLAPGKPVMNVRLSVRRCLRILGVEIVFPEIKQRAIYCPCCAHTETDVMKIVALAGM